MPFRFAIYSTENTDPNLAVDSTFWGPDPREGEYDPRFEWQGRGSHKKTLGGVVHQDYGFNIQDRKIHIVGRDMDEITQAALQAKYQNQGAEWNFTDGLGSVFRVRFSRQPAGFIALKNFPLYAKGLHVVNPPPAQYVRYAYELLLRVVSQVT